MLDKQEISESAREPKTQPAVRPSRGLGRFDDVERMLDWMFDDLLPRRWSRPFRHGDLVAFEGRTPRVDVIDRENEVLVKAELPGVDKGDLDVSTSDRSVTIKATSHQENKEEKGDYYRSEIARGSYVRTVALPAEVDGARCKATFKNGLLELVIPKLEQARRHRIEVH
ncbi:MAG TPA: Hsp20/alpha crystallin family protein [Gammaproteobacteria bacterium]|nr:Hsp20/alpha crystallin family protein [Gammaproteobacteria bacterium]